MGTCVFLLRGPIRLLAKCVGCRSKTRQPYCIQIAMNIHIRSCKDEVLALVINEAGSSCPDKTSSRVSGICRNYGPSPTARQNS